MKERRKHPCKHVMFALDITIIRQQGIIWEYALAIGKMHTSYCPKYVCHVTKIAEQRLCKPIVVLETERTSRRSSNNRAELEKRARNTSGSSAASVFGMSMNPEGELASLHLKENRVVRGVRLQGNELTSTCLPAPVTALADWAVRSVDFGAHLPASPLPRVVLDLCLVLDRPQVVVQPVVLAATTTHKRPLGLPFAASQGV